MNRSISRWLPVLAVIGVLGIAVLAATLSSPEVNQLPGLQLRPSELPSTDSVPASAPEAGGDGYGDAGSTFAIPDWVLYAGEVIFFGVLAALVVGLVWLLVRNAVSKPTTRLFVEPARPTPMAVGADGEVIAAVEAGLVELSDTDTDPRRAVIACWVRLERAAAAAGTPREVGDSPTELVSRLLSAQHVTRSTLEGLAAVYLEARYATHPVDDRSRRAAIEALRLLRADLGAGYARDQGPQSPDRRDPSRPGGGYRA